MGYVCVCWFSVNFLLITSFGLVVSLNFDPV